MLLIDASSSNSAHCFKCFQLAQNQSNFLKFFPGGRLFHTAEILKERTGGHYSLPRSVFIKADKGVYCLRDVIRLFFYRIYLLQFQQSAWSHYSSSGPYVV